MPQAGGAAPADVAVRRAAGSLQAFDGVSALHHSVSQAASLLWPGALPTPRAPPSAAMSAARSYHSSRQKSTRRVFCAAP
jgi:hypothetical protein